MGLAIRVDQLVDVGDVDGLGSSTARNEQVGLDSEVEVVSEVGSIGNDLSRRQLVILVLDQDNVSLGTQL